MGYKTMTGDEVKSDLKNKKGKDGYFSLLSNLEKYRAYS